MIRFRFPLRIGAPRVWGFGPVFADQHFVFHGMISKFQDENLLLDSIELAMSFALFSMY